MNNIQKNKEETPKNCIIYQRIHLGTQYRPNTQAPIAMHEELGRILCYALSISYNRKIVYNNITDIIAELDEWVQREHKNIPNDQFLNLYMNHPKNTFQKTITPEECEQHTQNLLRAKELLISNYPDCAPLKSLLKKIDVAIKSLRNWV